MFSFLRRLLTPAPHPQRRRSLRLETLEDRAVPTLLAGGGVVNPPPLDVPSSGMVYTANATSRNGLSVVVWSQKNGANGSDLCAQLYKADHTPLGGKIQVTEGNVNDVGPSVSMANNGNWVVSWTRLMSGGDKNVYAERFSSSGTPLGSPLTVAATGALENTSSVASAGNGDFVIAYTSQPKGSSNKDVLARTYRADGTFLQSIAVANSRFVEQAPAVARSTGRNAGFSIAYEVGMNIRLKTYSAKGSLTGSYVIASNGHTNTLPAVARDDAGDTVVAWQLLIPSTDPQSVTPGLLDWSIDARRVSSAGVVGSITRIVSGASSDFGFGQGYSVNYTNASVAMKPSGTAFVVGYAESNWNDIDGKGTNVHTTEVSSSGTILGTFDGILAANAVGNEAWNPAPSVSISAQGSYLLSFYDKFDFSGNPPSVRFQPGQLT